MYLLCHYKTLKLLENMGLQSISDTLPNITHHKPFIKYTPENS